MKNTKKIIGVLGGIGAAASVNFYNELVKVCQKDFKAKDDCDFPQILINSMSFKGFDAQGKGNKKEIKKQLVDGLKVLKIAGADFGVIACNTVHEYFDYLVEESGIELLSMIDETVKSILLKGHQYVGILSSRETKDIELYSKAISKNGIKSLVTSDEEQKKLDVIIGKVISGKVALKEKLILKSIIEGMYKKGVDAIILGCTEIPIAYDGELISNKIYIYNTNHILAKAALKKSYNLTS